MPRAYATDPEEPCPVRVVFGHQSYALGFSEAVLLSRALSKAVQDIERWFQCAHEQPNPLYVDRRLERCWQRGKVKIAGKWYCKPHAKKHEVPNA